MNQANRQKGHTRKENRMKNNLDIIRAWKNEEYRESLSAHRRASLPVHPAGHIELIVEELEEMIAPTFPTTNSSSCLVGCHRSARPAGKFRRFALFVGLFFLPGLPSTAFTLSDWRIAQTNVNSTNSAQSETEKDQALQEARKLNIELMKLRQAGKYDEARPLAERVLEISEKALGKEHRSEERRVGKECRSRWSPYH